MMSSSRRYSAEDRASSWTNIPVRSGRSASATQREKSYLREKPHRRRVVEENKRALEVSRGYIREHETASVGVKVADVYGKDAEKEELRERRRKAGERDVSSLRGSQLNHARSSRRRENSQTLPPRSRFSRRSSDFSMPVGIWLAASDGDTAAVREYVRSGKYEVDEPSKRLDNKTPLHLAALHDHAKTLQALLDHGADPNLPDSSDRRPVHLAARYGSARTLVMLLNLKEVDINCVDACSLTPLMHSIIKGEVTCVKHILGFSGVDLDVAATGGEHFGQSSIAIAKELLEREGETSPDRREIYEMLVNHGASKRMRRLSRQGVALLDSVMQDMSEEAGKEKFGHK